MEEIEKVTERWDFYQILVLERRSSGRLSHHLLPAMEIPPSAYDIEKLPRVKQGRYTVRYKDGTMQKNVPLFYPDADDDRWLLTCIDAKGVVLTVKVFDLGLLIAKEK